MISREDTSILVTELAGTAVLDAKDKGFAKT